MSEFIEVPASKHSLSCRKLICGVGINDAPYMVKQLINGKKITCPYYHKWCDMVLRCYSDKFHFKYQTYINCAMSKDWIYFMNFRAWMKNQDWKGKSLDKDIINPNNKLYSPKNCCFVTLELNNLLINHRASRGLYPQGVCKHTLNGKYLSNININGKRKHLGLFTCIIKAESAYLKAKIKYVTEIALTQHAIIMNGLLKHVDIMQCRLELINHGKH